MVNDWTVRTGRLSEVSRFCEHLPGRENKCSGPEVGVHFVLYSPLWSDSEVAQLHPTFCNPLDSSLHQAPPSMGFSRQEYWSGCHLNQQRLCYWWRLLSACGSSTFFPEELPSPSAFSWDFTNHPGMKPDPSQGEQDASCPLNACSVASQPRL